MFVTEQLHLLKPSAVGTKALESKTSGDFYIKSLITQIYYLKEENKIKNSTMQLLVQQNPSSAANSQNKNNNNNDSSSFKKDVFQRRSSS